MAATSSGGSATAPRVSQRGAMAILGRYQGPEFFFSQPWTALNAPVIPRNLNLTRPMESIKIVARLRDVISVAAITNVAAEAPMTFLQRIRLTGTHSKFNQLVPTDISGATLFAWGRLFQIRGASCIINGTRIPELSMPIGPLPAATFGNVGTYDIEIHYNLPLGPMLGPGDTYATTPFLFFSQDWQDTLQLQLFMGDATSMGTGGATQTFTAFGSGAGTPVFEIYQNFAILGPLADAFNGAVVVRSEQQQIGGPLAAVGNNVRMQLLQKQKTNNILVKTGAILAATSAGVNVFQTLSDAILDATQIVVDNKPVRNNFRNFVAKEYAGWQFNTIYPQGYLGFSFVDSLSPLTAYRGDLVPGGSTFELDSNVLVGSATNAINVVQEQVFGDPRGKPMGRGR